MNKGALSFHFALSSANYVAGPAYKTYMWKENVSVEYRSKCPRLGFQHEQGGVRESGARRGGVQGERQLENDGEYCKNKITKREAGSKGKIEQEIKIYIKEGREQWRESGQSQRDDRGNLLTEEVLKIPLKEILIKD